MKPVASQPVTKGETLLLQHCRALDEEAPRAYSRLELALGGHLARLLVSALGGRPHRGTR